MYKSTLRGPCKAIPFGFQRTQFPPPLAILRRAAKHKNVVSAAPAQSHQLAQSFLGVPTPEHPGEPQACLSMNIPDMLHMPRLIVDKRTIYGRKEIKLLFIALQ